MAKIIEKAFDATKKVIRTIFVGQPNLFTTSDVNRQLEAFKYQLDHIEKTLGYLSDMNIQVTYNENTSEVSMNTEGTFLEALGCRFNGGMFGTFTLGDVSIGESVYFIGQMTLKELVYGCEEDPQHEIVGAKFEDNTSRAAANQLVITDTSYFLSKNIPDDETLVRHIVLAKINIVEEIGSKIRVIPYFVRNKEYSMGVSNSIIVEREAHRIYDTDDFLGYENYVKGKITDGVLHIVTTQKTSEVYRFGGIALKADMNTNYPTPSNLNLLTNAGWRPEWFENFKFTYKNPQNPFYAKFIPLAEATQGYGKRRSSGNRCDIISCKSGTIGIVLIFNGGTSPEYCTHICMAVYIPNQDGMVAFDNGTREVFRVIQNGSSDADKLTENDTYIFCAGNFYLDLVKGGLGNVVI